MGTGQKCFDASAHIVTCYHIICYIAVRFAINNTIQFPIGLADQKDNVDLSLEENQFKTSTLRPTFCKCSPASDASNFN